MRLPVLPIPLLLALLSCSPSTSVIARSPASLQPISSQPPVYQLEKVSGFVRLKRQDISDGTPGGLGGGSQTGSGTGGDSTTEGDTAAGGTGADTTTQAATTNPPATTTSSPAATQSSNVQQTTQPTTQPATTSTSAAPAETSQTTSAQQQTSTQPTSVAQTSSTGAASSTTNAPTSDTSVTSSPSSVSTDSSASSAASSSFSTFEVTFTSTFTNADGSVSTSTGTLQSASAVPIKQNESSNTGKIWGIAGGVVGGVVVILVGAFLIYRMSQRRFSNLDDHVDEIKWPELQPDGQTVSTATSTLKPLDTHRTGGAGIGDDGDDWDSSEPFMANNNGGGGEQRRFSSGTLLSMSQNTHDASYEQLAMVDQGGYASHQPQGHYDPFLGPSSAPYPPPQNVYPPSPYTSSPSINGSPNLMGSSPDLRSGPMGAPGAGGAIREGSPPPRDMFAANDGFRSASPQSFSGNYRGGPL
ncbi:uncharacterized protein JCM6883_001048 [Sporobolomyces salmoneus]|uniref:uncharacterized protein n=1 Tax=Sporobolomyces salmoneus TaxID=183962 RepID=UPI00316F444F